MKKSFSYNITKRSAMPRSKRLRNIGVAAMSTKNIVAETGDWLPRSEFDEILETIRKEDGTIDYIKAKHTLVSFGDLQSLSYADPIEGGSDGSVVGLLTDWSKYDQATAKDLALSAELGYGLLGRLNILESIDHSKFLTAHQDISHLATNSALTAHINDTAVHITAAERAKWNKTATDLSAILGADSNGVIDKWKEVTKFLETYTEADTLADLLSHKADKATTLAGYGITDAYTKTALNTLLDGKVSKAGDTMTGPLRLNTDTSDCPLRLYARRSKYQYVNFYDVDGSRYGYLGTTGSDSLVWSGNTIWHSGNMGHGSELNADLLDGFHASDLFATKTLFSKADYQHYVVLLWKTNEIATHRISGKLYTETAGSLRYQAADIDMWFSRWNATSYDSNLRLVTYGLGTAWKLVTCTYNGEEWYALQHTNIQATAACFVGVSARINFTAVKYYTSNTSTVDNAEIYNSIVDRSNLLKRSYVGGNAIAYITDTVAAADKLSNNATFTAWGQTFFENGVPKSVSGNLTGVGDITASNYMLRASVASNPLLRLTVGSQHYYCQATSNGISIGPTETTSLLVSAKGNVGIGTTSPAYKLDVAGTTRTTVLKIGSITLKDVNGHLEIDKTIVSLGDVQSLSDADVVEGGGMIADMLKEWSAYNNSMADTHALSAGLGVELHNRLTGVENNYVSKTAADNTYQPKGNYLTSSDISNLAINTETFWTYVTGGYTAVRFRNAALAQAAHDKYLEFWQSDIGFFNIKAGKFITSGGTSAQFLMADGSTASKVSATSISHIGWSDAATDALRIPTMTFMAFWNGAFNGNGASNLQYCDRGRFGDIVTQSLSGLDGRYVNASGDTMTGALTFLCGTDTKLIFDNTDGEKYTKISFREAGAEYGALTVSSTTFAFSKLPLHATHYIASTTTLCTNLNADLLDGCHNGDVTAKLINYNNDGGVNQKVQFMQKGSGWNTWDAPTQNYYSVMKLNHGVGDTYYNRTLAFDFFSDAIYAGRMADGSFKGWRQLAFIDSNVASATNADKTDGYHADINETANTLVTRDANGHVNLSAIKNSRAKSAILSSAGWYRVFTSAQQDALGDNIILNIARSFNNTNNEAYQFSISLRTYGSGYKPCITQISGTHHTHLITKIRVVQKYNSVYYIDIYYSGTNANHVYVSGFGAGTFSAPVAATIPDGYTATEFDTVQGVKSNNQIISTDSFHLPYSSISEISKYLQLASGSNEMIFASGSSSGSMYVNYRAATIGTTVTKWIWCAGTSTSRAAMEMGDLTAASLSVKGASTIDSTLFVGGGVHLDSTLYVDSDTTIYGPVYMDNELEVNAALSVNGCIYLDLAQTKEFYWDYNLNAFHLNGTLVVDGDIQSLSNGPDYEEVVRLKLTGYDETVSIPATAKEAIITVDGDQWEKTIQLTGDLADLDVIKLTIYDYGVMGDTWKYGNTSITVNSGRINVLAILKGRGAGDIRFMKLI